MADINVLFGVINTLNTIPVAGKQELSKMLGCISALESIAESLQNTGKKEEESNG